jgi:hypothetical protein
MRRMARGPDAEAVSQPFRLTTGPMPGSATLGANPRSSRIGSSRSTSDGLTRLPDHVRRAPGLLLEVRRRQRRGLRPTAVHRRLVATGYAERPSEHPLDDRRPEVLLPRDAAPRERLPGEHGRAPPLLVGPAVVAASWRDNTPASSNRGDKTSFVAHKSMNGRSQK